MKSRAIEAVTNLFLTAEEQADTIKSQKEDIIKLNKQLEDTYSTETHILMTRNAIGALADKFDELADEFNSLDGVLDDISSYADSIRDEAGYNDAYNCNTNASDYATELRNLLNKETEEVESE
tara:strand:+ start:420 stop:788 length:369 start_codon:yes stop_codon:yes gene_type:complete